MPSKILVVDDEPDLADLVRQRFRKKIRAGQFEFFFAADGNEALVALSEQQDIDIVLTDINMPGMDGLTLLLKLNEQHPLMKSVIISAYGDMRNIRTALNRGAFDFVTKPIDFEDLEITIEKTLRENDVIRQAARDRDRIAAMEQELAVARNIQQSLLPKALPQHKAYEVYASMIPAREVGGDLYDFFEIDEHRLGLVIGDVSGKGVPASLFMAVCKTLLKSTALNGLPPGQCFQQINRVLHLESPENIFVTMFYGILDSRNAELSFCNAGHNDTYVLSKNGDLKSLGAANGIPLSFVESYPYQTITAKLAPGDTIFLYTDGVNEAMDIDENEFSEERLQAVLKESLGESLENITGNVLTAIEDFTAGHPQSDDITTLMVRYN